MIRKRSNDHGFTLIELMIVVVIIGILAALAIPRFWQSTIKTRQSEAKLVLKQVCTSQMLYRAASPANSYFITGAAASSTNRNAFSALDMQIAANAEYSYTITGDANNYVATATANLDGDATVDTWTIGPSGVLACTSDDASS